MPIRNDPRYKDTLTDFQRRYEPNFAWANAIAGLSLIPGLRGLWPFGVHASGGNAIDHSGLGKTLTYNGNPTYGFAGLISYMEFDGTGDYLSRTDEADFDIIGNESYILAADRGLTVGGWFVCDSTNAELDLIAKWDATGNQRAYLLYANINANMGFNVSTDGTNIVYISSSNNTRATASWNFCAGRFTPSTEVAVFLNSLGADELTKWTNAVSVPATIFNSSAAFTIGARATPSAYHDGKAALCWVSAMALSDTYIRNIFHQTRALFGV